MTPTIKHSVRLFAFVASIMVVLLQIVNAPYYTRASSLSIAVLVLLVYSETSVRKTTVVIALLVILVRATVLIATQGDLTKLFYYPMESYLVGYLCYILYLNHKRNVQLKNIHKHI